METHFGHTMRKHDSLEKDIITGNLPGKRTRGRPKTSWMNNITAWTGLTLNVITGLVNGEGEILTHYRIETPEPIDKKIGTRCHLVCGQSSDRGILKEEDIRLHLYV